MTQATRTAPSGRSRATFAAGLLGIFVLIAVACGPQPPIQVPDTPPPPPGDPLAPAPLDCARWRYDGIEPQNLPGEWNEDDYRFGSWRDPGSAASPHRLCGQLGSASDLSWNVSLGSPDVLIAVIDSGIEWRGDKMPDLVRNAYVNTGELPVPQPAGTGANPFDSNGDGRVNAADYSVDPRVGDRNGNELIDPEDLILAFSDGTDADGNGYVDDISGWDFLNGDNNPLDDVGYGHGTGEARDSTAAHDGEGSAGTCPNCSQLPVRVGDSFIAEGGRFAASVLFALDSGADVIQEALGAISNPPQAQQAIDAAYRRGVPVVASMADEQSQHANLPGMLEHTIPVNSLTQAPGLLESELATLTGRRDALALNGCTNTGAVAWVSVPSNGCSSEATGNSAGMVGLLESAAREGGVAPHPDLAAAGPGSNVLSANEAAQILRASADDVDFSTPNAVDPANENTDDFGVKRFPTVKGWDATTGYGRINAYGAALAASTGDIPPEADITSPEWFSLNPTRGTLAVEGRVAAVRSSSYDYRVEWTVGLQTDPYPAQDTWHVAGSGTGLTAPLAGTLANIDLAEVAAALPDGATGTPTDSAGLPEPDRFTIRMRVVVTDAEGRVGTQHRVAMVHDDPDGGVVNAPAGLGTGSPVFHDLDSDGADELVVTSDDGAVHALRPGGSELPGWPNVSTTAPWWPTWSATAASDGIAAPGSAVLVGAPAIGDLDGDGDLEVTVTDADGGVRIIDHAGRTVSTMSSNPAFSAQETTDKLNRLKPGFYGSAAIGDLDGDGDLEVVAASADRHLYAWHHDGTPVAGFPVLLVDPAQTAAVDPGSHAVTFANEKDTAIGGELIATPTLSDLTGDGRPEIVVGAQEEYMEQVAVWPPLGLPGVSGNTRLYAVSPDGTLAGGADRNAAHPDEAAYLPGWPVAVPMLLTDVLPTIGNGVATQAATGDIDGDGENEVVAASASGQVMAYDADGTSPYAEWSGLQLGANWLGAPGGGTNSEDTLMTVVAFGGASLGELGGSEGLDIAAPTTGLARALDTLLPNDQPGESQLTAWSGSTGEQLRGFPRVTADLGFFVTPAIADVDGDGTNEVVAGHGVQMLDAVGSAATGAPARIPSGWPKLTGGWTVGTPGMGDWDGDGTAELAITRRDGHLLVWQTPTQSTAMGDWIRYGGGPTNSGASTGR
ncbi:MAG: FG-GAP-like repeat-containing protein [Microthrixaceae bacterium]